MRPSGQSGGGVDIWSQCSLPIAGLSNGINILQDIITIQNLKVTFCNVMLIVIPLILVMLSVIRLKDVTLSVMAPYLPQCKPIT